MTFFKCHFQTWPSSLVIWAPSCTCTQSSRSPPPPGLQWHHLNTGSYRWTIVSFPNLTFVSEYVTSPSSWCRRTWRTRSCRTRSSWCSSWAFCPFLFKILLLLSFTYFIILTNYEPTESEKEMFKYQRKRRTRQSNQEKKLKSWL
jgi:hypothetical protein